MPRAINESEMRTNIDRLRKRFAAITDLDPSKLNRYDPKVEALQAALDDALHKAFGGINDRYNRYRRAIKFRQLQA